MNHTAYEEDFIPWVETQAALLRDRKFDLLDIPNLYEELTSMASHIRHQLASRLRVLEVHLLKRSFQPNCSISTSSLRPACTDLQGDTGEDPERPDCFKQCVKHDSLRSKSSRKTPA